jgi:hypothetical protein
MLLYGLEMNSRLLTLICTTCFVVIVGACRQPQLSSRQPAAVGRLDALDGLTQDEVISRLGNPISHYEFSMSEVLDESHTRLQKYFPMPERQDARIRELNWHGSEMFTNVWFHETNGLWRVFDSRTYGKDVVF